jgi:hypothetical protein
MKTKKLLPATLKGATGKRRTLEAIRVFSLLTGEKSDSEGRFDEGEVYD